MAAPVLTLLNHTELDDADDNTGWNDLTTADTDIKVEGTASMSGILRADGEQGYYDHGSAPSTAVGKTVRGWINTTNIAYMGLEGTDPYKLLMYDGTTTEFKTLFGSDTYPGGWFNYIWDCDEFTTLTLANVQRWGVEAGHATNARNVVNTWMDVMRYLDGYSMTGGTSGDEITLGEVSTADKGTATLFGYGVITAKSGVYFCTGTIQLGTGATTMWFEMDGDILIFEDQNIAAGLYSISGVGTGSRVTITNSVIKSAGTTDATRFVLDMSDADLLSCSVTNDLIVRAGAVTFKSGQTAAGSTFDDCGPVTAAGADLSDCVFKNYEGTVDTSPLIWDVNTDPDTYMDGSSFTKGTVSAHAIEFGTTSPLTMNLTDMAFSGYNAADTNTDSTFHVKRGSGTVTINCTGCTGNLTYKSEGATVIINAGVTVGVNVKNVAGTNIQDARVLIVAATGGPFPFDETVTIVNSGTLATVTHNGHGMESNDKVRILGASHLQNRGVHQITYIGVNSYSYTMASDPGSSPTGTIKATFVALFGLTSGAGDLSTSREYASSQPITGIVRKTSSSPYYQTDSFTGTVDSATGFSSNRRLLSDE